MTGDITRSLDGLLSVHVVAEDSSSSHTPGNDIWVGSCMGTLSFLWFSISYGLVVRGFSLIAIKGQSLGQIWSYRALMHATFLYDRS